MADRCDSCKHVLLNAQGAYACRRFPPQAVLMPHQEVNGLGRPVQSVKVNSVLPLVDAEFSCGEYKVGFLISPTDDILKKAVLTNK